MSKPIPEEEYGKKPLSRLIRWVSGEADPYRDNMEIKELPDFKPNEKLNRGAVVFQIDVIRGDKTETVYAPSTFVIE